MAVSTTRSSTTTTREQTAATARRVTLLLPEEDPPSGTIRRRPSEEEEEEEEEVQRSPKRLRYMYASGDPAFRKLLDDLQDEDDDIAAAAIWPLVNALNAMENTDERLIGFCKSGGHRDFVRAMARHANSEQFQVNALEGLYDLSESQPKGFRVAVGCVLEGAFNAARSFPASQEIASYAIGLVYNTSVAWEEQDVDARYANMKRFIEMDVILDCVDIAKKFPDDDAVNIRMLGVLDALFEAMNVDVRPIMEVALDWISKVMKNFPNHDFLPKYASDVVKNAAIHPNASLLMFEKSGIIVDLARIICERCHGSDSDEITLNTSAREALLAIIT